MVALDRFKQLQAVELAALQPDVEKHQMRTAVGNFRQRRIAVARGPGGEPLVLENARNQIADICLVIDNQNIICCHGSRPVLSIACCGFDFWFVVSRAGRLGGFIP